MILICIAVLICVPPSCFADDSKTYDQVRKKIDIGQSKQTIRELLGPPDRIINSTKRNKYIWGPEELFWDEIPMGAKLEVYSYMFSDGGLNLYFVDGSEELNYIAFAPKGVVY
ncbi:MAG: hypothetical protein AABY44_05850 [Nitrospirota bacterium]